VDRLEDVLRAAESSDDLVLLLRGGEDTRAKLLRQAALFEALRATRTAINVRAGCHSSRRAARSTSWPCSNRSSGRTRSTAGVPGAALAEIAVLLPTFQAPHWTVMFRPPGGVRQPEEELLNDLLDIPDQCWTIQGTCPTDRGGGEHGEQQCSCG
jgi:hypothetical protein